MTNPFDPKLVALAVCLSIFQPAIAQDPVPSSTTISILEKKTDRPFRITTNAKKITIKSQQPIKRIMAWTASGHRFVESRNMNETQYSFEVPGNERVVFVMVQFKNGKHYTEKVGL